MLSLPPRYNKVKTRNRHIKLQICFQIQEQIISGVQDTARSWQTCLLHCMVSAPFSTTVLKQSKQIKVLHGITSQNTASLLHEYNIYKCQKSRGSGDLAGL